MSFMDKVLDDYCKKSKIYKVIVKLPAVWYNAEKPWKGEITYV